MILFFGGFFCVEYISLGIYEEVTKRKFVWLLSVRYLYELFQIQKLLQSWMSRAIDGDMWEPLLRAIVIRNTFCILDYNYLPLKQPTAPTSFRSGICDEG